MQISDDEGMLTASPPALVVEAVTYFYGARCALDDVSFSVQPATFAVLLGLNGAGKSTLFALITRLYGPRCGNIRIFGHNVGRAPGAALRHLGVVFQSRTLDLDLTVTQNLIYDAALHGIGTREARKRAGDVLSRAGLDQRAGEKVRNLSGGQMRRVEIARALMHRPRLLVLDEPTVGLDIKSRADTLGQVRALAQHGIGVLWATHLIDEVRGDDQVIILHEGRVLADGSAINLMAAQQARDLRDAFDQLTRAAATEAISEVA